MPSFKRSMINYAYLLTRKIIREEEGALSQYLSKLNSDFSRTETPLNVTHVRG